MHHINEKICCFLDPLKKKSGQDVENYKERMALLWEEKELVRDLIRNITHV